MSENMPDFDKMTPDEITAWLETLAKRQGATEGFTTSADADIAEVDPDTVIIDEPGYVPFGQENTQAAAETTNPPPPAQMPKPAAPPPASVPESRPHMPGQSRPQEWRPATPPASAPSQPAPSPIRTPLQPAARMQTPPPNPPAPPAPAQTPPAPPQPESWKGAPSANEGGLAWLESLAADQGEDLFNLDLSGLPEEVAQPAEPAVNPMTWLEDLARSQVAEPALERIGAAEVKQGDSEKLDPYAAGVNPIEWLETLARRQGAKEEELTTHTSMNIPAPAEAEVEEEEYQPFSFDTPPSAVRRSAEAAERENPAEWLTSLAGSEGYSEEGVRATQKPGSEGEALGDIETAIADGTVTREQMQTFLDQQAEVLAQHPEELYVEEEVEEEQPIGPAELPDWLSELKPQEPPPPQQPVKSLDELFEPPAVAEMPSWLKEDLLTGDDVLDLQNIFAPEEEAEEAPVVISQAQTEAAPYEIEVDPNDPWVEAFDLEYEQGMADIDAPPDWYEHNLHDPERIAAVEGQAEREEALEEAPLPAENDLPVGQPEAVPSWMADFEPEVKAQSVFEEIPDWLKEVESSVSPEDVPDWLVETISEHEPEVAPAPVMEQPVVVAAPPPPASASPPPKPAPQPVYVPPGEVHEVLTRARDREQSGDLEGALTEYEGLIRANLHLDAVITELSQLVKSYKTTPAVYRVLGDGLMRQGKLQDALDTYREALNQL